jgi:hypothetical protein
MLVAPAAEEATEAVNVTGCPTTIVFVDAVRFVVVEAMYVNRSAVTTLDVPPGVVTVTSTVPAVPAGLRTTILVAVFETMDAAVAPKRTLLAPARLVPEIVTRVPPGAGPLVGESCVTAGTADGSKYVYRSAATFADVPPAVVTVTSTGPAARPGLVATIWVAVFVRIVAGVIPKRTLVAPPRFEPEIVT